MLSIYYFCLNHVSILLRSGGSPWVHVLMALGLVLLILLSNNLRLVRRRPQRVIEVVNYLSVVVLGGHLFLVVIFLI